MEVLVLVVGVVAVIAIAAVVGAGCVQHKTPQKGYQVFEDDVPEVRFSETVDRIVQLFNDPMERSSIAIDTPRLCFKTTIVEGGAALFSGDECWRRLEEDPYALERATGEFITALATRLEGADVAERFMGVFRERLGYIAQGQSGDCAGVLQGVLGEVFVERSPTVCVLKLLTQGVFAAAIRYLLPLRTKHRFHDEKGGWRITVEVVGGRVVVRHEKAEVSYQPNGFRFLWTLQYEYDVAQDRIGRVVLHIAPVEFRAYADGAAREMTAMVDRINQEAVSVRE